MAFFGGKFGNPSTAGDWARTAAGAGAFGGLAGLYGASKNFRGGVNKFIFGAPEKNYQQSLLGKEQQPLYNQMQQSLMQPGAGGAFGSAADYYRGLMSNDSQDFDAFAAPEMRRFQEQIVPGLAEQFAGMGSGALSSSGFRNAAVGAGTDLSERLGSLRAQLRQQGAQGLNQMGQFGLGQFNENILRPAQPGFIQGAAEGAGKLFSKWAGSKVGV